MSLSSTGELTGTRKEANTVTQFDLESQLSGHSGAWQWPTSGERRRERPFSGGLPRVAQEAILGAASREVLTTEKSFSGGGKTQIEPWPQQCITIKEMYNNV